MRRRVTVYGRVQGVFFRDSVRRRAEAAGVSGWVRNREDGAVEGEFEGPDEAVGAIIEYVRKGPGRAEVEKLDVSDAEPENERGFQIR